MNLFLLAAIAVPVSADTATVGRLNAVANHLAAVGTQLGGALAHPTNPGVPPNPVAPTNQLEAIAAQLVVLQGRVLAAVPNPPSRWRMPLAC